MNEDFSTRAWSDNHARFAANIAGMFRSAIAAMRVLNAKQFDAPWRIAVRRDCTEC